MSLRLRNPIHLVSVGVAVLLSLAVVGRIPQAFAAPAPSSTTYYGIAAAPSGDVYVTVPQEHRVERRSATGEQLGAWGSEGNGEGEFVQPKGIAVAADGTVYVVDGTNARVQYFTGEGQFLGQWGASGEGDGEFFGPEHVAVAPNGDVYVTDYGNYRVQYFTRDGRFLGQWGSQGSGPGEFNLPLGVAVGGDGTVYVTDLYNNRVQYFTPDGQHLGEWETQPSEQGEGSESPHGVGVGPDGTVYCANFFEGRVERYSTTGEFLESVSASADSDKLGDPQSVAFTDDGTMYVADAAEVRVCSAAAQWDTTAPEISVPADIVATATDAVEEAVVTFEVSAVDAVDGIVSAVADPPSGSLFPVGQTTVVVTAQDSLGNAATRSFTVSVVPAEPEPSATTTSSGEESAVVPPAGGGSDPASPTAGKGSPLKSALLWVSLLGVTAFVTTRKRWRDIMLGFVGLVVVLLFRLK